MGKRTILEILIKNKWCFYSFYCQLFNTHHLPMCCCQGRLVVDFSDWTIPRNIWLNHPEKLCSVSVMDNALDNRVYPKIYLLEVELQILTLPKGVILSGFIRIFAILCFVSIENLFVFCRNTKTSEFSDTAKSRVAFCWAGFKKVFINVVLRK
jgi:hypothetical protein